RKGSKEIRWPLPGLELGAEEDDLLTGGDTPIGANGIAINKLGFFGPPIVVDHKRNQRNPFRCNSKGAHETYTSRRRDDDLVCQAKKARPEDFLDRDLPPARVARRKPGCVRTEQKCSPREL